MVRTLCSHCQEPRVRELGSHKPQGPPSPSKIKIISKLNFRAVNYFFFKSRSEFKFKSTLSRCESSRGSWLRLGIRVGGSPCEQEEEEEGG